MNGVLSLLKNLFDGDLRYLRSLSLRASKIHNSSIPPIRPGEWTDLSCPDDVDSALAHVYFKVRRVYGITPHETQLVGALAMIEGRIAEMGTGEGKTLVAVMVSTLLAAAGRRVHIMTVNEYLVGRDSDYAKILAREYGIRVGSVVSGSGHSHKHQVYNGCLIIYSTPSNLAFDYLRDCLAMSLDEQVLRNRMDVALFDEIDSILIDEATVPMVLSGRSKSRDESLSEVMKCVSRLNFRSSEDADSEAADSVIDHASRVVTLSDRGHSRIENLLVERGIVQSSESLYDRESQIMADVQNCLEAISLYQEGRDYIVLDDRIVIINQRTGRMEPGRRWSHGLHQAIEAKEGVSIQDDHVSQAKITVQAFSRLYESVVGMTGTAKADESEFRQTYGLRVLPVPPKKLDQKQRLNDRVFRSQTIKYQEAVADIEDCVSRRQPVLVGVQTIEEGELFSSLLESKGVPHYLLTARQHESEARIIAQAGQPGSVTIATNMAGRGTDILLGGPRPDTDDLSSYRYWEERRREVIQSGGLKVIGLGRNDALRIDQQLEGRCGRQGDPGVVVFYCSLEDDLLETAGGRSLRYAFDLIADDHDSVISGKRVDRVLSQAQKTIQGSKRSQRIAIEKSGGIEEKQRLAIQNIRQTWLESPAARDTFLQILSSWTDDFIRSHGLSGEDLSGFNINGLSASVEDLLGVRVHVEDIVKRFPASASEKIKETIMDYFDRQVLDDEGDNARSSFLEAIDDAWSQQIDRLPEIYNDVQWRAMAQKRPDQEYAREAFESFNAMMENINTRAISIASHRFIETLSDQVRAA